LRSCGALLLAIAAERASFKHGQERMGHASPLTTLNVYTHTVTDEGRKYAEKVEAAFPFVSGMLMEVANESVQ
jgi:integrase